MNLVHNRDVYIIAHAKNPLETKRARFKGVRKEHLFLTSVIRECKMQGTINPVSDYIVVKRVMAEEVVNHRIVKPMLKTVTKLLALWLSVMPSSLMIFRSNTVIFREIKLNQRTIRKCLSKSDENCDEGG